MAAPPKKNPGQRQMVSLIGAFFSPPNPQTDGYFVG
jgi:hypothetical protein